MKKTVSFLLVLVLLCSMVLGTGLTVSASTDIADAKSISVNTTYSGTIEEGSDYEKDYYKFTLAKSGYVTVRFTNTAPTSWTDGAWSFALLRDYGSSEITSTTACLNDDVVDGVTIGLAAGTYYIRVESARWHEAVSTAKYSVRVNFNASNYWEKEYNEEGATANTITTNTTYYGTICGGYDYEKDYYKFTLTKSGAVTVKFTNSTPTSWSDEAWNIALLTDYGSSEITSATAGLNQNTISLTTIGLAPGTYYIRVQSARWYEAVSTVKYAICAELTPSNYWETEYNEDNLSATAILSQDKYSGTIRNGYDYETDYYKFTTTDKGDITVTFCNPTVSSSGNGAWYFEVYDPSLSWLASRTVNLNETTATITLAAQRAGTYYVRVTSTAWYTAVSNSKYQLSVKGNGIPKSTALTIQTQPKNTYTKLGKTATAKVSATGVGLKYQWYVKNAGASSYTKSSVKTATYSVKKSKTAKDRLAYCVITDSYGAPVRTKTIAFRMAASITTQPMSVAVAKGATAKVTVKAMGDGLSYRWYYKDRGMTSYSYTSSFKGNSYAVPMTAARNGRQVLCRVYDTYGNMVQSNTVKLSMKTPLKITKQPASVTVAKGTTAKVTVKATGDGLTYRWYYKDRGMSSYAYTSSYKGSTYSVTMTAARNGRQVLCRVYDKYGKTVQTNSATLRMK